MPSPVDKLLKEHEEKLLAKQDVDSMLYRLRQVRGIRLPDRVYNNLPSNCLTEQELRDLVRQANELVDQLAKVSNHLYDELSDLANELEYQRRIK